MKSDRFKSPCLRRTGVRPRAWRRSGEHGRARRHPPRQGRGGWGPVEHIPTHQGVSRAPEAYGHCHPGRPYPNVPRAVQAGGTTAGDTVCRPGWSRGAAEGVRLQPRSTRGGRRARDAPRRRHARRRGASAQCALLRLLVPPIGAGQWRFYRHAYGCRRHERHGRRCDTTRYGPSRCDRRGRGTHCAAAQRCAEIGAVRHQPRARTWSLRGAGAAAGPTRHAYAGCPMRRVAQTEAAAADRRA